MCMKYYLSKTRIDIQVNRKNKIASKSQVQKIGRNDNSQINMANKQKADK